ncbi:unnamed protein product [Urochloa decumbens]|uniref:Uncharacterized protein n=1 Tax=Urochloa decumbens TaxID=240449 RepID=A0ABC9H811_9POAL
MGEMVASALAQEGVSRVSSYISTKLDDKASREQIIERLVMALYRLEFALERTATQPITYVSLLRCRKKLKHACIEGTELLNKHKQQAQEGQQEARKVVVRSSSYLQRIIRAAKLSITSLLGLNEEHMSTSIAQKFERYADCADKFVADVESVCPLRHDPFRYPFVRQLFEGKYFSYGSWGPWGQGRTPKIWFRLFPMISEGRGIEACLQYSYFDPERLDKSLHLWLMLRLSESTDIVGIAISCLRSSASLLNLAVKEDAVMGELIPLLSNYQDISYPYDCIDHIYPEAYAFLSRDWRPDPVCCHANVHKPGVKDIVSSDLSHIFPEQVIQCDITCYIPAAEYSLPTTSDKAGIIRKAMMIDRVPHLELSLFLMPHYSSQKSTQGECYISKNMGNDEDRSPYGSIHQTIDTARSEAMECLLRQPEVMENWVSWWTNHGYASFQLKRPSADIIAAVASTRGRYNTRSAAKRKR